MDYDWKDTFHYTQRERRGIFILATIFVVLLFIRSYIQTEPPSPTDFSSFKKEIIEFEQQQIAISPTSEDPITTTQLFRFNPNTATKKELVQLGIATKIADRLINYRNKGGTFRKKQDLQKIYGLPEVLFEKLAPYIVIPPNQSVRPKSTKPKKIKKVLRPFRFDPNFVSKQELVAMGLSDKTAQQIVNYRNKGGKFYKKEDFKKIYAINAYQYQQLEPFILIKQTDKYTAKKPPFTPKTYKITKSVKVDVNKATLEDWQQLKGIGPFYAKKIVGFREKLGGFASIEQIGSTYNLPDSVYQNIRIHLIYSPIFRPLSINKISLDSLKKHPFINSRQAQALLNYRANHGPFGNWEAVGKVKVLSTEQLALLKPYLRYE